jgi:hypothetical protein
MTIAPLRPIQMPPSVAPVPLHPRPASSGAGEPDDIDEWLLRTIDSQAGPREAGPPIHSFLGDVPSDETKPLRFRTAREIAEATSDEVAFAAAYLAFGAITELHGKPKAAGKTTFVLELVRAVLHGAPFLGRPTVKGLVVMLTEQPTSSLKAALMRAELTRRDDFVLLTWADAAGRPWPDVVRAAAAKCHEVGARVLIVDTLPQFAGLRGDAENNSGDALEAIEPLQLLAVEGFAILVARHDRKSGGDVGDSARGSGAFTGAVDTVVAMSRNAQDSRPTMRRLACLSRFSEPPPDLVIELVNGRYVVLGTSDEELARVRRARVLDGLSGFDHPQRVEALAETLGEKEQALRELLNELLRDGLVARHGEGVKGKPYLWSRPSQDGSGFPFVSLRETGERKETAARPGRSTVAPMAAWSDEEMAVEDDYPASAWDPRADELAPVPIGV